MKHINQRAAAVALVLGILAVPAVVLASTALLDAGSSPTKELAPTLAEQPVAAGAVEESAVAAAGAVAGSRETATAADLQLACGAEGASLVARETSGDISPLEQAALDALRPICRKAGLPLAAAARPDPVVIVETVMTLPVESSAPSVTTPGDDRDDHEDDRDDDEHDEHDGDHDEADD